MKRKGAWICILLAILTIFSGCADEERDKAPFSADEVECVEVYRYVGVPAAAEKKTAVEGDEIEAVCNCLAAVGSPKAGEASSGGTVISFRMNLKDGTAYEMIFVENGSEDWAELETLWNDIPCEAAAAEMDELPTY